MLHAFDHDDFHRATIRLETQAKLLLNGSFGSVVVCSNETAFRLK